MERMFDAGLDLFLAAPFASAWEKIGPCRNTSGKLRIGREPMDAHAASLRLNAGVVPDARQGSARVDRAESAFERCWQQWSPGLARMVAALGIANSAQGDVLQDVYLAAHQKWPHEASEAELRRWLYRVTANRCRLEHRRTSRLRRMLAGWISRWPSASSACPRRDAQRRELEQTVERALDKLAPLQREIVVLRYFADFDAREIGEMLSMPHATVRSHLLKARRHLAQLLAPWNDEEGL